MRFQSLLFVSAVSVWLCGSGGAEAYATGADGNWLQEQPQGQVSIRYAHTAIYDSIGDRMVVFGGSGASGFALSDVWALALGGDPAWTQLTPAVPLGPGRIFATAIYDPVRDRMVEFGGYYIDFQSNQIFYPLGVYELSLAGSPVWTLLAPTGFGRYAHTAIYDPVREQMVVFGGALDTLDGDSIFFNDVWMLSLRGNPAWTQLVPLPADPRRRTGSPSARAYHTAIYDPIRDRMVVFGGYNGTEYVNDVWALELAGSPEWTQLAPLGTRTPSARGLHTAIYDPVRDRMVVFGGFASGDDLNDVWALELAGSSAWTQMAPLGTPPSAREAHTAIYDPVRDRMVAFGGFGMGPLNDVWDLTWGTPVSVPPEAVNDALSLASAFPNPSRSDIAIAFTLPRAGAATLRVYDVSGRLVRTLVEGTLSGGSHLVHWDRQLSSGKLAPSGSYFYELRVDGKKQARRIVLIN